MIRSILNVQMLTLGIFVAAATSTANAQQILCNSAASCQELANKVQARAQMYMDLESEVLFAPPKNADGSLKQMPQKTQPNGEIGAVEYCESVGARLPSDEEFNLLLPKLSRAEKLNKTFWTATILENDPLKPAIIHNDAAMGLDGTAWDITSSKSPVRCMGKLK